MRNNIDFTDRRYQKHLSYLETHIYEYTFDYANWFLASVQSNKGKELPLNLLYNNIWILGSELSVDNASRDRADLYAFYEAKGEQGVSYADFLALHDEAVKTWRVWHNQICRKHPTLNWYVFEAGQTEFGFWVSSN